MELAEFRLMKQYSVCVCACACVRNSQYARLSCRGKWKSSWRYWQCAWFTEGQCVVRFDEKFTSPVFFEGPTVTGNISWLWWRTVLCVM